jgi:hypothetical protein
MTDARLLLERQARWQRARQALSWPEKVRMAEAVRESVQQMRKPTDCVAGRPGESAPVKTTPTST